MKTLYKFKNQIFATFSAKNTIFSSRCAEKLNETHTSNPGESFRIFVETLFICVQMITYMQASNVLI